MQVNRGGIALIAFFSVVGLVLVVAPVPGMAGWILKAIGGIWFLVGLGLYLYAHRGNRKAVHQQWVFQNGIRGHGTLVKAGSHAEVNGMPLMKLTLDLDVPGRQPRRISRREIMPVFVASRMEPGIVLPVYVNPQDPEDLVLVW